MTKSHDIFSPAMRHAIIIGLGAFYFCGACLIVFFADSSDSPALSRPTKIFRAGLGAILILGGFVHYHFAPKGIASVSLVTIILSTAGVICAAVGAMISIDSFAEKIVGTYLAGIALVLFGFFNLIVAYWSYQNPEWRSGDRLNN